MAKQEAVKIGGGYVESEDHVPNPTDMVSQYNTSGVGAHHRIEEVSPIFEVDKAQTAAEIKSALDPDDDSVPASRVLLPDPLGDNETAVKNLKAAADARLKDPVVVGGPTPAQREAALEGKEGNAAAVSQESRNSVAGDPRVAGQHDPATPGGDSTTDSTTDSTEAKTTRKATTSPTSSTASTR